MKTSIKFLIAVVIIGIIGFAYTKAKPDQNIPAIKIGAVLSLSGDAVADGESIKNGLELAREDLKKKGIRVDIIYQDDRTDPKNTVTAINVLSAQGVEALVGPTWSYLASAGVPVSDSFKMVNIQPANTSEFVSTNGSPYTFFASQKVARLVPPLTKWMKENDIKRVALITSDGAWYDTVGKAVREAAAASGAEIVMSDKVPFGVDGPTMANIVTKVKASSPDLLFAEIDDMGGILAMFKKSNELKLQAPVMSVTSSIERIFKENSDLKFSNGVYIIAPVSSKEFQAKFKSAYNKEATVYADRAYDSLMIIADAIRNKGDMTLENYMHQRTNYKGFMGQYKFDERGDITGGEWVVNSLR